MNLPFDVASKMKDAGYPQEPQPPISFYYHPNKTSLAIVPDPRAYMEMRKQIGAVLVRVPVLNELFYVMRGCSLNVIEEGDKGTYGGTCLAHEGKTVVKVSYAMSPDEVLGLMWLESKLGKAIPTISDGRNTIDIKGSMFKESPIIKP